MLLIIKKKIVFNITHMHNVQVNINDKNSCIKGKDLVINHTCVNQLYSLQTISSIF